MSCARFTHPFEIRNPILVREKQVFAPVATLRDMVRDMVWYTGGNDSGKPGCDGECVMIVIRVCVTFIFPFIFRLFIRLYPRPLYPEN